MTLVLVHGVPETADIWEPMVGELATMGNCDVVYLSPPDFGAPRTISVPRCGIISSG